MVKPSVTDTGAEAEALGCVVVVVAVGCSAELVVDSVVPDRGGAVSGAGLASGLIPSWGLLVSGNAIAVDLKTTWK
jgi:hypothetical protein